MPHDHHGHLHPDPASGDRRIAVAIWANGLLTVAQVVGGLMAGSLALIADALHNFSDMAALLIAFAARRIARRPADARMTFGYGRIEVVAALINYTTLILIGLFLIREGAMRLIDPPAVGGWTMVIVAGIALAVDAMTALLVWSMQKGSVNMRALFLHNLADAMASLAVIAGGVLILLFDMRWVDPAITIGIAGYILWLSLREIGRPIRILMLGSPEGIDVEEVIAALRGVAGVCGIHHVHLWQMQEHVAALDCHVVLEGAHWHRQEAIRAALKALLHARFGLDHVSLEFEHADRTRCEAAVFGCAAMDGRHGHGG